MIETILQRTNRNAKIVVYGLLKIHELREVLFRI